MMVKNRLQSELNKSKTETLEYHSVQSKDIAQFHFDPKLINKGHLSKGAKRNFDQLVQVCIETDLGPRPEFVDEIE